MSQANTKDIPSGNICENVTQCILYTHFDEFLGTKNGKVTTLESNNVKMLSITSKIVDHFPNLETIKLENCFLKVINVDSFDGLSKLRNLNLSKNNFTSISTSGCSCFQDLGNLEVLCLSHNKIKIITERMLKGLRKLRIFHCEFNEIHIINVKAFFDLIELRPLNFSFNELNNVHDKTFENNGKLEEINLSHNKIKFLRTETFKELSNLKVLVFRNLDYSIRNFR